MRPLLRWAGSKKQLLPPLQEFWIQSQANRYVEPFAGSAALFFSAEPKKAILGDINNDLIGFYRTIKRFPESVYELASSYKVDSNTYYEKRDLLKKTNCSIEKSAIFYYLNRYCFNGIYRTNTKGDFNVPYSGVRTGNFPKWEEFSDCVRILRRSATQYGDFESLILNNVNDRDFVYLDPPYAVANRRVFKQYNAQSFGIVDIERLKLLLKEVDARGAKFVLSYALCRESLFHFSSWICRRVVCQRNVSGFSKDRRKAVELIISNFSLQKKRGERHG